jgi:GT2 family glycosyltransferase
MPADQLVVIPTAGEVSVAQGWNIITERALADGADYVLIPNTDIVFHPQAIDNLIAFAKLHPDAVMWTGAEHDDLRSLREAKPSESYDEYPHFSCFMINQASIDKVGWFNKDLRRAYMEDLIYHFKIVKLGFKALKTASALFYHYGSRTIRCDEKLNRQNLVTHEYNRTYCARLLGFDAFHGLFESALNLKPHYATPFNDPSKHWRDV